MAMYEIYFSPTGGTKKVAEIIGSAWSCETERVDLMNPALQPEQYAFSAADICIVAVPSFGGRVPVTAVERLKKMAGNGARAVLVAVIWKPGIRRYADGIKRRVVGWLVFAVRQPQRLWQSIRSFVSSAPEGRMRKTAGN